jgi:hypothetical protein
VKQVFAFLTLTVLIVGGISVLRHYKGTVKVMNAGADFLARGYAAELGYNPIGKSSGTRSSGGRKTRRR